MGTKVAATAASMEVVAVISGITYALMVEFIAIQRIDVITAWDLDEKFNDFVLGLIHDEWIGVAVHRQPHGMTRDLAEKIVAHFDSTRDPQ
jgi:hypothetical protein